MARKSKPIQCIGYIPDGNGGYRLYDELSTEEKAAFTAVVAARLESTVNYYYSAHPEEIEPLLAGLGKLPQDKGRREPA